jgi:Tfp pilus assembly protein PilN
MKTNEIKQTISLLDKEIAKHEAYIQTIGNLFNDIQTDHFEQVKKTKAIIESLKEDKVILESLRNPIENYRPLTDIELIGCIGLNVRDRKEESYWIKGVTVYENRIEVMLESPIFSIIRSPRGLLENYTIGPNKDYLGIKI